MHPHRNLSPSLVVLLVAMLLVIPGCGRDEPWTPSTIAQSTQNANTVLDSIRKWQETHDGAAPKTLRELEDAGDAVPRPLTGTLEWSYHVREDGSFQLAFGTADMYPCCSYDSRYGEWRRDE